MGKRSFNAGAVLAALLMLGAAERTPLASAQQLATSPTEKLDTPPETATVPVLREDGARPVGWERVEIVVYKSKRTLALYRFGYFEKEFPVVLGLVPGGRKRYANDARTPEGFYHITSIRSHERWQFFLALDYPNDHDRETYAQEMRSGKIPEDGGRPFAIGGAIGIHGNDRPEKQDAGVDWTKGCIAMKAADISELARIAAVGTPVWIVE